MQTKEYLEYIVDHIHSTVFATVDSQGRPVTCAIDIMDYDESGLYFLTAKGKNFYDRLKANENVAFTAMKGQDTLSCVAVSVQGKAKEIGADMLPDLFRKNPYMETVVLLSKLNAKQHIEVELNLDELDLTAAESKATYEEIKEYVLEKHGLKVSSLYISQVKRKCGLDVGKNYNLSKKADAKVPQCPSEKEAAIMEALKYFSMI